MKKFAFVFICFLMTLGFISCSHNTNNELTVTIENYSSSAYFIAVKKNGNSKSEFINNGSNPGTTIQAAFENGTVIDCVEFYSGIDLASHTMPIQMTYDSKITRSTTLVIGDGKQVYKK